MKGKRKQRPGETAMRTPIFMLFFTAAVLLGETQASRAQNAYSYPWCSLGGTKDSNALSCYYTSWEQCRITMSGIGGLCVQSPYYRGSSAPVPYRASAKLRHR